MSQVDISHRHAPARISSRSSGLIGWAGAAVVLAFAALLQAIGHLNGDDAWFLTFAEKFVDGQRAYVDVADPNPPAAFIAYVPAVHIARLMALRPECVLVALTLCGALLSTAAAGQVLRRAGLLGAAHMPAAASLAIYLCLVVPAFCFAEREHLVVLALLPFAAVLAARAAGQPVSLLSALVAGAGAGLTITFKPYFLLPVGLAWAVSLRPSTEWLRRSLPEIAALVLVLAIHAGAVILFFPDYLAMFALALDVYAPVRDHLLHLLASPLFLANASLLGAWLLLAGRHYRRRTQAIGSTRWQRGPREATLWASAALARICAALSLGFLATFVIQGKGWNNHALPGIVFGLMALAAEIQNARQPTAGRNEAGATAKFVFLPLLCAAPFLFGAVQLLSNGEEHRGLLAAVAQVAPPRPKIAALAEQLDFGHPLVRQLAGTWIGRRNCLWVSWGVKYLRRQGGLAAPAAARLARDIDDDLQMFAQDVASGKPDILLVESGELEAWARRQPALSGLFDGFAEAGHAGAIEIWRRKR